jgi:predicted dehydrogenase
MRFAAIGLDHRHIYDLTQGLLEAGLDCAGYWPETTAPIVLEGFQKRFPGVPAVDKAALLGDPSIAVVALAAVPCDRAALAIEAMRYGKDVLCDKPGVTTLDQLAEVEQVARETGRIFSVCFGRFLSPALEVAMDIARQGGIGRLVQMAGLAPHRLNRALRPDWFFEREKFGGILNDLACHHIDSFLALTGATEVEIAHSAVGQFGTAPDFDDFGEIVLRTPEATAYVRVDWFTPDGLPTWGDGRMFLLGTEGTLELRKNLDIEGRPGTDHVFVADRHGTRHIDAGGRAVTSFRAFAEDVARRPRTGLPQRQVFDVCRLALQAQARATRLVAKPS